MTVFYQLIGELFVLSLSSLIVINVTHDIFKYIGVSSAFIYVYCIKNVQKSDITFINKVALAIKIITNFKEIISDCQSTSIINLRFRFDIAGRFFPKITIFGESNE